MVWPVGFEPTTLALKGRCSTVELRPQDRGTPLNTVFYTYDLSLETPMVAMSTVHLQDIDGHKVQVPRNLVIPAGLEPATYSLEGCCSIQLSYGIRFVFDFIGSSRTRHRIGVF